MPPEIQDFYEDVYFTLTDGKKPEYTKLSKLRQMLSTYPDFPQLYNLLYNAYTLMNNQSAANQILEETIVRFPDYIFANVIKATYLIRKNKFDDAKKYTGSDGNIHSKYPKTLYHISEIVQYYNVLFEMAVLK